MNKKRFFFVWKFFSNWCDNNRIARYFGQTQWLILNWVSSHRCIYFSTLIHNHLNRITGDRKWFLKRFSHDFNCFEEKSHTFIGGSNDWAAFFSCLCSSQICSIPQQWMNWTENSQWKQELYVICRSVAMAFCCELRVQNRFHEKILRRRLQLHTSLHSFLSQALRCQVYRRLKINMCKNWQLFDGSIEWQQEETLYEFFKWQSNETFDVGILSSYKIDFLYSTFRLDFRYVWFHLTGENQEFIE